MGSATAFVIANALVGDAFIGAIAGGAAGAFCNEIANICRYGKKVPFDRRN